MELSILSFILILFFPKAHCTSSSPNLSSVSIDDCPPWYYQNESNTNCFCKFTHTTVSKKYVYRGNDGSTQCLPQESRATLLIQLSYCLTFDSNKTHLVKCPYNTALGHDLQNAYVVLNTSMSDLNNFTCTPLERKPEGLCNECRPQHGPSPFTLNLTCFDCSSKYSGWLLYLTFELFPLTIFFVIVTALKIRPSQGYLNSFILLSQLIASALSFSSQVPFIYSLGMVSRVIVRIIQTLYGFWNLDFFRYLIPGFCVSPSLNNLDIVSLQLISVFYPISLIVIAWIVVHLYEINFKPLVWVWRPFRRCLSHFSVTSNPKRAVVNLFTTFLLLSYSKVLFVIANLTNTTGMMVLDPLTGKLTSHSVLYLTPDIKYFGRQHARYVALSFFLVFVFILPPPLILLLYPTTYFQTVLNKCYPKSRTIRMFAHACHSCFKNGLNDTRDCRHFAGAYLLLRVALFLCKTSIDSAVVQWIMVAVCFGVAATLIGIYRPYKYPYLSLLDTTLMIFFAISALFVGFITTNDNPTKDRHDMNKLVYVLFAFVFLCLLLPLIYITCLLTYHCKKKITKLRNCLMVRRRDYLDISEFEYDPESSDVMDHGQTAKILRSRLLNSDSFQSE